MGNLHTKPAAGNPGNLSLEEQKGAPSVALERAEEVRHILEARETSWSKRWLLGHARLSEIFESRNTKEVAHLQQMSFEELIYLLHQERRQRKYAKIHKIKRGVVLFLISLALHKLFHWDFLFNPGVLGGMIVSSAVISRREKDAALLLTRFDDVRAIGPLAEALEYKDREVPPIAARALIQLLPRLKASDASLLSPTQRACLNRALEGNDRALVLAILKAWEQVGTEDAIKIVQNLSYGRLNAGRYPDVASAARECLPSLRASAQRHRLGADLLRAANGHQTLPETLLRPARPGGSDLPEEQLLRPHEDV